ncbi:unnamed protein product, partial [Rotaria sp. Silwood1]
GNEGFYGVDKDFAGPRSYGGHGGFGSYAGFGNRLNTTYDYTSS